MERIGIGHVALILLASVALAGTATAQTCMDPPAGMISWWTGDGSAMDVATGYHGAVLEGAGFAPGRVGDAFAFDGVGGGQDDQVMLSHLAVDGLANLTVEFWVNSTDDDGSLVSGANGDDRGGNELLLIQRPTGLRAIVKGHGSGDLPASVNDGLWHHVALVREGEIGRVYVDGAMIDERTYPMGSLAVGPQGLLLGQEQDCLAGCFALAQALDGLLDEVTVYGRALSAAELIDIVDAGSAGKCRPEVMPGPGPGHDDDMVIRVEDLETDVDAMIDRLLEMRDRLVDVEESAHVHTKRPKKKKKRDRNDDDDDD
jgi:hypothetical protein